MEDVFPPRRESLLLGLNRVLGLSRDVGDTKRSLKVLKRCFGFSRYWDQYSVFAVSVGTRILMQNCLH